MKAFIIATTIALTAASTVSANVFPYLLFPDSDTVIDKPVDTDRKAIKLDS